jgi:hypothetical protein
LVVKLALVPDGAIEHEPAVAGLPIAAAIGEAVMGVNVRATATMIASHWWGFRNVRLDMA